MSRRTGPRPGDRFARLAARVIAMREGSEFAPVVVATRVVLRRGLWRPVHGRLRVLPRRNGR